MMHGQGNVEGTGSVSLVVADALPISDGLRRPRGCLFCQHGHTSVSLSSAIGAYTVEGAPC